MISFNKKNMIIIKLDTFIDKMSIILFFIRNSHIMSAQPFQPAHSSQPFLLHFTSSFKLLIFKLVIYKNFLQKNYC